MPNFRFVKYFQYFKINFLYISKFWRSLNYNYRKIKARVFSLRREREK